MSLDPRLSGMLVAALINGLPSSPTTAAEWRVIDEDSHLAFHGSMLGVPVTGFFTRFESRISFDPHDLDNAHISVMIDMTSIDSAHEERDFALKLPEWFATQAFPEARFETTGIRHTGEATYEALASLTIKGIRKDITLPFSLAIDGDTAVVSGALDLARNDFNIGEGEWASNKLVAFEVQVEFRIVAQTLATP